MNSATILALVLAQWLALGSDCDAPSSEHYNSGVNWDMVDAIRGGGAHWEPYNPGDNPLRGYSDEELKYVTSMPGVDYDAYRDELRGLRERIKALLPADSNSGTAKSSSSINEIAKGVTLPTSFDWRTTADGKRCMPSVQSQGTCGACYAFAASSTFAARYCQAVSTATATNYSPQDILACNTRTYACNGGILDIAFNYLEEYGLTTLACQPYMESSTGETAVPKQSCMATKCSSGAAITKKFCKKGTSIILYGTDRIKYELMQRGPLATFMTVYSDLTSYKSGVYKQTTGVKQGGHAVVLVGWGVSGTVNYWIVMNSWGSDWGESGYFRIDMTDTNSALGEAAYYCVPET